MPDLRGKGVSEIFFSPSPSRKSSNLERDVSGPETPWVRWSACEKMGRKNEVQRGDVVVFLVAHLYSLKKGLSEEWEVDATQGGNLWCEEARNAECVGRRRTSGAGQSRKRSTSRGMNLPYVHPKPQTLTQP